MTGSCHHDSRANSRDHPRQFGFGEDLDRTGGAARFDLSFAETVLRHQTRPEPIDVTAEQMRAWYSRRDLLGVTDEHVLDGSVTFEEAVDTILDVSGLVEREPLTPCPVRCRRCAAEAASIALPDEPAQRKAGDGRRHSNAATDCPHQRR